MPAPNQAGRTSRSTDPSPAPSQAGGGTPPEATHTLSDMSAGTLVAYGKISAGTGSGMPELPSGAGRNTPYDTMAIVDPTSRETTVANSPRAGRLIPIGDLTSNSTRVMSPSGSGGSATGVLLGVRAQCGACLGSVVDPVTCSRCGKFGHGSCLGIESFQGLPFCNQCICETITEFARQSDMARREEWRRSYTGPVSYTHLTLPPSDLV